MQEPSLIPSIPSLLTNNDPHIRQSACFLAGSNWRDSFAPQLVALFRDSDPEVRHRAASSLHWAGRMPASNNVMLKTMVDNDAAGASQAVSFLEVENYPRAELIHFFSSTNLPVVARAFIRLRHTLTLDELSPLLANPLPMARMMALVELERIRNKLAIDRVVAMLHDPDETVRWRVRSTLRRTTGQSLGSDPAAYEKWWKENRRIYTRRSLASPYGE
jgi:HEAT repeat protein